MAGESVLKSSQLIGTPMKKTSSNVASAGGKLGSNKSASG